jgi:hypothetical protein
MPSFVIDSVTGLNISVDVEIAMALRRRTVLGAIGGGLICLSGCVEIASNTVSGCVSSVPEDANSASEIRDALPDYETEAATEDEHWDRADNIQDALWHAVDGHPWRCSMGQKTADGELIIVVDVTCVPRARKYIPSEWGGVTIRVRQTACGSHEVQ